MQIYADEFELSVYIYLQYNKRGENETDLTYKISKLNLFWKKQ